MSHFDYICVSPTGKEPVGSFYGTYTWDSGEDAAAIYQKDGFAYYVSYGECATIGYWYINLTGNHCSPSFLAKSDGSGASNPCVYTMSGGTITIYEGICQDWSSSSSNSSSSSSYIRDWSSSSISSASVSSSSSISTASSISNSSLSTNSSASTNSSNSSSINDIVKFIGYDTSGCTSSTTCTVTKPTALTVGDLMIAHIGWVGTRTISPPNANWTLIQSNTSGNGTSSVFWKFAVSSDVSASDFAFTCSGSAAYSKGAISIFRYADINQPIGTSNSKSNGLSLTCTSYGITPAAANSMIVFCGCAESSRSFSNTSWTIANSSPVFSEKYDTSCTTSIGMACALRPQTTDTGNATVTLSGSARSIGILFAIQPYGTYIPSTSSSSSRGYSESSSSSFSNSSESERTSESSKSTNSSDSSISTDSSISSDSSASSNSSLSDSSLSDSSLSDSSLSDSSLSDSSISTDSSASTEYMTTSSSSSYSQSSASTFIRTSSSSSSESSELVDFVFDKYHTINEPTNMGKNHFITLYSNRTVSKTPSNVVFHGDAGVSDMTFAHWVEFKINGVKYYTPIYTGDPTVSCCSILTGDIFT